MKTRIFSILAIASSVVLNAQTIDNQKLKEHIVYLSSDKLEGRGTASKGEKKAAKYIAKQYKKIGLQPKGDDGTYLAHFTFKRSKDPHGNVSEMAPIEESQNVVAYLDNGASTTVVIGAHYDHLGLGYDHNSLEANPEGKIHNGADDNASGTAAVIELARYYAKNNVKESVNFLFINFSGEELGLLGSKKYCEKPTIDLKSVNYMINIDMIGRLNEEKRLIVGGVGSSPSFVPAMSKVSNEFTVVKDSAGIGPSDHTSFYLQDIPVLFFFTGAHGDYHKPSDDADKINYTGEEKIMQYIIRLSDVLCKENKLKFQKTASKQEDTPRFKVTLGIMPDYAFEGPGVRVDGVTNGKPAEKAGLAKGDIILQLGEHKVEEVRSYMKALSKFQKGDTTKVKVKRGDKEIETNVTF